MSQMNLDQFLNQHNHRGQYQPDKANARYQRVEPENAAQRAPRVPEQPYPTAAYQPIPQPPPPQQAQSGNQPTWEPLNIDSRPAPQPDWGRWTLPIVSFRYGLFEKLWGNGDYANFGEPLDYWCDVVPGMASKAEAISDYYGQHISHLMHEPNIVGKPGYLTTLGVIPMSRRVELVKRGTSTVTIYLGQQGRDLFLSWQVFVQGRFSYLKAFLVFLITVVLAPVMFALAMSFMPSLVFRFFPFFYSSRVDALGLVQALGIGWLWSSWMILTPIWLRGIIKYADMWAFFRNRVYPIQMDDAAALGGSVYYALLRAVDQAGIDVTKLQPRLPQYIKAVRRI